MTDSDALARRIAELIHDQFVVGRGASMPIEWAEVGRDAWQDAEEKRIGRFTRALPPEDRAVLGTIVARIAADALISMTGLLNGSYGLGLLDGREGTVVLTYDGVEIGEALKTHLLDLDEVRIAWDDAEN